MLIDFIEGKLPEYYPTMYMDGYTPEEIKTAHAKKMKEMIADNDSVESLNINSSIEAKDE